MKAHQIYREYAQFRNEKQNIFFFFLITTKI